MHIAVERTSYEEIRSGGYRLSAQNETPVISSAMLREGVVRAAEVQRQRYKGLNITNNARLSPQQTERFCRLDDPCSKLMEAAFTRYSLSARAYHRILRTARTIADLAASDAIREEHLLEALSYRMPERFFEN